MASSVTRIALVSSKTPSSARVSLNKPLNREGELCVLADCHVANTIDRTELLLPDV
jgi:hypothetical protein